MERSNHFYLPWLLTWSDRASKSINAGRANEMTAIFEGVLHSTLKLKMKIVQPIYLFVTKVFSFITVLSLAAGILKRVSREICVRHMRMQKFPFAIRTIRNCRKYFEWFAEVRAILLVGLRRGLACGGWKWRDGCVVQRRATRETSLVHDLADSARLKSSLARGGIDVIILNKRVTFCDFRLSRFEQQTNYPFVEE